MAKIIISYRRTDSDVFAGRIRDRIASRYGDNSVFMDIDDIPFGKDFRQHIKDALTASDLVVVIIGPRWLGAGKSGRTRIQDEADPVRIEVETALQHGVPIIPILVGDTKMPRPTQLPEALKNFAFINAAPVDTGRDFHPHMGRLLREIDRILRAKSEEPLPVLPKREGEQQTVLASRGLWIGGALVLAALLAGVGLTQLPQMQAPSNVHFTSAISPAVTAKVTDGSAVIRGLLSVPGLDCGQPKTQVERTICESEELSSKYKLLSDIYLFLQSRRPTDEQLKADQADWRNALDRCRGDGMFGCINNAHDARIVALKMGPSYPCHIDKKRVEQAVCKDALLSTKDQVLHDVYQRTIADMTVATYRTVRVEQQNWITSVRDTCDEPDMILCVHRAYDGRIAELDKIAEQR